MPITQIPLAQRLLPDLTTQTVQHYLATSTGAACCAPNPPLWLDVHGYPNPDGTFLPPTEEDLQWLASTFNFHPLTIEDCRHFNQRSKVEQYDTYLFISMTLPRRSPDHKDILLDEIQVFLGKNYMVTVHNAPLPALTVVPTLFAKGLEGLQQQADFLLYRLSDILVDGYFPLLDELDDEIDLLEAQVLQNPSQATLQRIFALKQQLVVLRKVAGPLRDAMGALASRQYPVISPATTLYFRDIYDHLTRIYEIIEASRDLLANTLDIYLSSVSNRLNEVMKRLTLFATIFMPLSFIVGFGGMNFAHIPFGDSRAFFLFMAAISGTPIIMLIWFWRSRWI